MDQYYGTLTTTKRCRSPPPDVAIDHCLPPYSAEKNAELKLWFERSSRTIQTVSTSEVKAYQ
jgi:hypothetical protein